MACANIAPLLTFMSKFGWVISCDNFSLIKLEMKAGTDIKNTLREADRKINGILSQLPTQARKPTLTRFDFNDLPVMRMGAYSNL